MRSDLLIAPALLLTVAACTRVGPGQSGLDLHALAYAQAGRACADIVAPNGGLLRFCDGERTLDVFESGLQPGADGAGLAADPGVLAALPAHLTPRPEYRASRRLVARACAVGDRRYLTISVDSLRGMLAGRHTPSITWSDPLSTGAIDRARPGRNGPGTVERIPLDPAGRAVGGNDAAAR